MSIEDDYLLLAFLNDGIVVEQSVREGLWFWAI
jgi:hypothetical protein